MPQNKLYDILKKFENNGILSLVSIEPKKYSLTNLNLLVKERLKEKKKKIKELTDFSKVLKHSKEEEENFVFTLIKGQKATMNKLVELNKNAKKEVYCLCFRNFLLQFRRFCAVVVYFQL